MEFQQWQGRLTVFPSGRVETRIVELPRASDPRPEEAILFTVPTLSEAYIRLDKFYDEETVKEPVHGMTVLR